MCLAACTSSAPRSRDTAPILITGDSIGPVPARGTAAQLRRASQVVRDTVEEGIEAVPESIIVISVRGDTVRAAMDSGRAYRLSVTSPRFRTADSIGPGTSLSRLLRDPRVFALTGEGEAWVALPTHCGLRCALNDAGSLGDRSDSVGVKELRTLPPATSVREVLAFGC